MPRSQVTVRSLFTASALSLMLSGCGNVSTTNTCDGSSPCHAGLAMQPAEDAVVKLHLAGGDQFLFGKVTAIDEQSIQLESASGGQIVASWNQVVAWEAGDNVREEMLLLEEIKRSMVDSVDLDEMIRETTGILPGAERD